LQAQQLVDALASSSSDDLDQLVAATTDTPEVLAEAPDAQAAAPSAQVAPNRELPLQDAASKVEQPALFHAEPTGHTLDVFDKASPTASIQVQHAWTKASLHFELPGTAQQRSAVGNKATAQVGDVSVTWTSFDDHLKEDLVLSKAPASNTITFNVQMHGLAFAPDGRGGWVLMEASGLPRFQLPAPTVKDALGHEGKATLTLTLDKATISVDPAFLSSAVYPVTIDPIINYVLQSSGTDFTYDNYAPVSQLKHVAANQTPFSTSDYTFDNVRNRILTSGTGGAITNTVDANGNLKARTGGTVNDSFNYDQPNRLTSATTSAGSGTYAYDGDGKRTSKTVSGVTTNYVYEVSGGLPRLLSDGTHKYVWGAQGLAYNILISTPTTVGTYHADQIGSIREITNADGSVRTTYLTDEYGVRSSFQGTDDQPFQYTGEQVDSESGFVYLRARYYEPGTGRFISRDRWPGIVDEPGTLNRYSYVANNPINLDDPAGLWSLDDLFNNCKDPTRQPQINCVFPFPIPPFLTASIPKGFDPFGGGEEALGQELLGLDELFLAVGAAVPENAAAGAVGFGTGRPAHTAVVTIFDSKGLTRAVETLESGNMTAEEAALGFPLSSLATHTENRAVRNLTLNSGDTMIIEGQYPPCPSCKGAMNRAARESGASIIYRWAGQEWIAIP
jgi:RHS repeat-associated protein